MEYAKFYTAYKFSLVSTYGTRERGNLFLASFVIFNKMTSNGYHIWLDRYVVSLCFQLGFFSLRLHDSGILFVCYESFRLRRDLELDIVMHSKRKKGYSLNRHNYLISNVLKWNLLLHMFRFIIAKCGLLLSFSKLFWFHIWTEIEIVLLFHFEESIWMICSLYKEWPFISSGNFYQFKFFELLYVEHTK